MRNAQSKRSESTPPFSFSTTTYRYGETDCNFVDRRRRVTADLEGVRYYGYRYYNPGLGRWINRDPIGERGGVHLYVFIYNSPLVLFDSFGFQSFFDPTPDLPEENDIIVLTDWEEAWKKEIDLGTVQFDSKTAYVGHQDSGCPCTRTWYCQKYIALADKKDSRVIHQRKERKYTSGAVLPSIPVPSPPRDLKDFIILLIQLYDRANISYDEYTRHRLVKTVWHSNYRWVKDGGEFACRGPVEISEGRCENEDYVHYKLPDSFFNFGSVPGTKVDILRRWITDIESH